MTRDRSFLYRAVLMLLVCACYRWLSSIWPELVPNISPMTAVALVGAMYLPRAWGWLIGPALFLLTSLAFLSVNARTEGSLFSWWSVVAAVFYALVGGLGVMLAYHKSLPRIIAGSIASSLLFYVLANTFAWWGDSSASLSSSYAPTLAGWWQANTVGLPGWQPTWTFLRNGLAGDLFFVFALLFVLDRALLLKPWRARLASPSAV